MTKPPDLDTLRLRLRAFAAERHWESFHAPKNLAIALSVEAAELLEPFQWLTEAESRTLPEATRKAVAFEAADVLLYLVQLADKLNIDLLAVADEKMEINARKYPVGSADPKRGE